jgi:hypothetical protein
VYRAAPVGTVRYAALKNEFIDAACDHKQQHSNHYRTFLIHPSLPVYKLIPATSFGNVVD